MSQLQVFFPADGELVNRSHGTADASGAITIRITGKTLPGRTVSLDNIRTNAAADGSFSIPYCVRNVMNEVLLSDGVEQKNVRFVCDFDKSKRYNFFIDDNVFFLTELYRKQHKSIFDSFYLKFLRSLHEKYGFKVTLNTFFENSHEVRNGLDWVKFTKDNFHDECAVKDYFTTAMLDERYKHEFEDNSDWLRLAFHSYGEFPDAPYREAYPEKLPEHHKLIKSEIIRYAGEKTFIEPVLMHFYDISSDASRKYIADAGMRCFVQPQRYWEKVEAEAGHPLLAKFNYQFGQLEVKSLFVVNMFPEQELLAKLDAAYAEPGRDFIVLGTHEQYSYPAYFNYIPEHFQRMDSVIRSLTEHGYESTYFNETLLK